MKKLSLILAAVILATSVVLTGCNNKPVENNNEKDAADVATSELLFYNSTLESSLEEYQPKEDLDKEVLATIGGLPISAACVRYTAMATEASYGNSEDVPEEQITKEVEDYYRQNAALINLAFKNGIVLEEKDLTTIKANITGMEIQYGEEYEEVFADSPFTKYYYYLYTSIYSPLFSKLSDKYLADTESDFAKQALEDTLALAEENEYVRAKHILITFPEGEGEDGELTDAQKAETLNKANEVLAKVNAMTDISEFDALIEEYNEDPGMESNPNGYYFTKGEMVEPFEKAAYELEEGKTSGLVETTYGYHILLKLPLNDEKLVESSLYSSTISQNLNEYLIELGNSYEIKYNNNYDQRVEEFKEEYRNMTAEEAE